MVDSNSQRSEIAPSDKGKANKMKLEAIKRLPGRPSKNNVRPEGADFEDGRMNRSDEQLAEKSEDSARQIQRYIRLTNLVPELQGRAFCSLSEFPRLGSAVLAGPRYP